MDSPNEHQQKQATSTPTQSPVEQLEPLTQNPSDTENGNADAASAPPSTDEATNEAAAAQQQATTDQKKDEPKQEVFVLGIDYGTQKCVLAVTKSEEMFPTIVQNNLANQITP